MDVQKNAGDGHLAAAYSIIYSFLNERSHIKAAEALKKAAKDVVVLKSGVKHNGPSLLDLLRRSKMSKEDDGSKSNPSSSSSEDDSSDDDDSDSSDDDSSSDDSDSGSDRIRLNIRLSRSLLTYLLQASDPKSDSSTDDTDSDSSSTVKQPIVKIPPVVNTKGFKSSSSSSDSSSSSSSSSEAKTAKNRTKVAKPDNNTKTPQKDTSSSDSDTSSDDSSSSSEDDTGAKEDEEKAPKVINEITDHVAVEPASDKSQPPSRSSRTLSSVSKESHKNSDSSSSSSESDSSDDTSEGTPVPQIKVQSKTSKTNTSKVPPSSAAKTPQDDALVVKKRKTSKSGASVPTIVTSTEGLMTPPETNKKSQKGKPSRNTNAPFSRMKLEQIKFADERLKDNTFHSRGASVSDYGARAHQDLIVTRGAGFRKEKNKKKKGNYKGGEISMTSHSIKFTD